MTTELQKWRMMDILETMIVAVALAMDCLAVSVAASIGLKREKIGIALAISLFFGFFQALMHLIGWLTGSTIVDLVFKLDHWAAFLLLALIGCKMTYESISRPAEFRSIDLLTIHSVLVLSIATSIDAFAVGLGFAFSESSILAPSVVIGTLTFLISLLGFLAGSKFGKFFGKRVEVAGGIILITIGMKILIEHLMLQ